MTGLSHVAMGQFYEGIKAQTKVMLSDPLPGQKASPEYLKVKYLRGESERRGIVGVVPVAVVHAGQAGEPVSSLPGPSARPPGQSACLVNTCSLAFLPRPTYFLSKVKKLLPKSEKYNSN